MPINDIYNSPVKRKFPYSFSLKKIEYWYNTYMGAGRSAEGDMICFYYLNESILELEKIYKRYGDLEEKEYIIDSYIDSCLKIGEHLLVYLLFICLRETRHAYTKNIDYKKWAEKYPFVHGLIMKLANSGPTSSVKTASSEIIYMAEEDNFISILLPLSELFVCGCFNLSCGGPKWKIIMDLFLDYILGNISLEILIDRCFNLEHNTSDIFNKGFVYKYSQGYFKKYLDIQNQGDISGLVKYCPGLIKEHLTDDQFKMVTMAESLFPLCTLSQKEMVIKYPYLKKYMSKNGSILSSIKIPVIGRIFVGKR